MVTGYRVFEPLHEHPLNPVDKFTAFVDDLLRRSLPDNETLPTPWDPQLSSLKYNLTLSCDHHSDWYTSAYLNELQAKPPPTITMTSRTWGRCGTVVIVEPFESKPRHLAPFPWPVENFESWCKMIFGKRTMQVGISG